jgi:hypothetical protein
MPGQIFGGRVGKRQLPCLHFGDDLPQTGHAQKQIGRLQKPASLTRQPPIVRDGP